MALLRVNTVDVLGPYRLRLVLTDGSVVERDIAGLLHGPSFDALRADPALFRAAFAEGGSVVWPNGADLCPDVLIWGGPPPSDLTAVPPTDLAIAS
jgi:hypothetical protein